ncbi:uncharacterized protein LOC126897681 [Daktulosphaira vitifoliae]|uniref:uncharacterized protein LOC126897681 n=1 Tax=Daktulosphaira vitifoliae TaxID=58002 RepID=UPI0021A9B7B5|nr:uncharacterized protein LOC126897681 [Daktulosphaira vitifoliae]
MCDHITLHYSLVHYWTVFLVARLVNDWIIKLVNRILYFDKLYSRLLFSSKFWTPGYRLYLIITVLCVVDFLFLKIYLICFVFWVFYNNIIITVFPTMFYLPYFMDYVVIANVCFFLAHIGCRFYALNAYWEKFPKKLLETPGLWSTEEKIMVIECCRLLHAELCDILRLLSYAYGPIILVYFFFILNDLIILMFIIIFINNPDLSVVPAIVIIMQNIFFIIAILALTTWTSNQKLKIIFYLRSCQIVDLPDDLIIQVKCFLKQVSSFNTYEMSAFGVFNYDMRLILSISTTFFKYVAIMLQMSSHNNFKKFVKNNFSAGITTDVKL